MHVAWEINPKALLANQEAEQQAAADPEAEAEIEIGD